MLPIVISCPDSPGESAEIPADWAKIRSQVSQRRSDQLVTVKIESNQEFVHQALQDYHPGDTLDGS